MNDLISKKELLKKIREALENSNKNFYIGLIKAKIIIEDMPTVGEYIIGVDVNSSK